jgi:hypothetical protein
VLAKESFALNEVKDAPGAGLAPLLALAAFSRMAWSFWAFGPRPVVRGAMGLGGRSLMGRFSHGASALSSRAPAAWVEALTLNWLPLYRSPSLTCLQRGDERCTRLLEADRLVVAFVTIRACIAVMASSKVLSREVAHLELIGKTLPLLSWRVSRFRRNQLRKNVIFPLTLLWTNCPKPIGNIEDIMLLCEPSGCCWDS